MIWTLLGISSTDTNWAKNKWYPLHANCILFQFILSVGLSIIISYVAYPWASLLTQSRVMFDFKPNACLYTLALNDSFEMAYHGFCRWWYNLMVAVRDIFWCYNARMFISIRISPICFVTIKKTLFVLLAQYWPWALWMSETSVLQGQRCRRQNLWVVVSARCSNILTCAMTTSWTWRGACFPSVMLTFNSTPSLLYGPCR